jgi:sensor histidine kinase YesM
MVIHAASPARWQGLTRILGWRRVSVALVASIFIGLLLGPIWKPGLMAVLTRTVLLGLLALLVFGLFEYWPKQLPAWLARWALQVLGVALAMPLGTFAIYVLSTAAGAQSFWRVQDRLQGFGFLTFLGLLVAPWLATVALLRHINGEARNQALAFELERSELERQALAARLRLLQAQIEPHFLFNTLANVRELVDTGSPLASTVLGSLIAYLRAAVPRLHEPSATLEQEFGLMRAYLDVMHMRMPDRLKFSLHADADALPLYCPPMTLLTLVENAVHHGIDPSEEGGRIEVRVRVQEGRCRAEVIDTGVGLDNAGGGTGTGLSNLRERLQLAFGDEAQLRLLSLEPHGVCAELVFPAVRSAP